MDIAPITIYYYQTSAGRCFFKEWLNSLDERVQQIVDTRLVRVRRGLFGDAKLLGDGIWELKLDIGPGYRIYYGQDGKTIIILLHAGQKKGQSTDIDTAKELWVDYLRRTRK